MKQDMEQFERKPGTLLETDIRRGFRIEDREKADGIIVTISLALFGLYLFRMIFSRTMFRGVWPDWYREETLRGIVFVLLILRFAVTDLSRRLTIKQWLYVGFAEYILVMCYASTEYGFALDVGIYLILFIGVSARAVLSVYCIASTMVYVIGFIGAQSGAIPDLNYYTWKGDVFTVRRALGTAYPTDCSAAWFYLILAFWILSEKIPQIISALLMLLAAAGAYYLCNARNNTICLLIAALGVLYCSLTEHYIRKKGKRGRLISISDGFMTAAFPMFAILTISLSWFYLSFNDLFSRIARIPGMASFVARFNLAHEAFVTYGISLFGTPFKMIGMGSSAVNNGVEAGYNFVDSSYCMILVRYGFMTLLLFGMLYVLLCRRSIREGWRRLLVSLAVIALQCVTEHHYTEIYYNITIVLLFTRFVPTRIPEMVLRSGTGGVAGNKESTGGRDRKTWFLVFYTAIVVTGVILYTPRLLSYSRTLVTLGGFAVRSRRLQLIVFIIVMLCAMFLFFFVLWRILSSLRQKVKRGRWYLRIAGIVLSIMIAAVGSLWVRRVFRIHSPEYSGIMATSFDAMESLRDGAENRHFCIYVDDIPELYREQYGAKMISDHIFTENGLCTENDCVVITDRDHDLNLLIARGFLYGELSEGQGIYSNSEEAITALRNTGIEMSSAYTSRHTVNLKSLARKHGLTTDENNRVIIDGNDENSRKALTESNITVYSGILVVEYNLRLISAQAEEGKIGKVLIRSDGAEEPYVVQELKREDFNTSGECRISLQTTLSNDLDDLEFPVIADEGTVIAVESITYGKTVPPA